MHLETVVVAPKILPGTGARLTPLSHTVLSQLLEWFSRPCLWRVPEDGPFDGLGLQDLVGNVDKTATLKPRQVYAHDTGPAGSQYIPGVHTLPN